MGVLLGAIRGPRLQQQSGLVRIPRADLMVSISRVTLSISITRAVQLLELWFSNDRSQIRFVRELL